VTDTTQYYDAEGNPVDPEETARMAQVPRKVIRRLEKEAEAGRVAQAENEQLKRERAFVAAGIPLDDKRASYFIAGYQGEQTPEAIRKEWNESFGGAVSTGQPSQVDLELAAQQGAQDLVTGVGSPAPDMLAQRNAELAALSPTDNHYTEKFDAIFAKYQGRGGSLVG
jgi:hypothetical protein